MHRMIKVLNFSMIGSFVMIAQNLYNKHNYTMCVMNVENICYVNNAMKLLFISIKCRKQLYQKEQVHLQPKKHRNH